MNKNLNAKNPSTKTVHEPLSDKQVLNNTGGFVFQITPEQRLKRFLILGSPNTFYTKSNSLTEENLANVREMWRKYPKETAAIISEISVSGRAPKNDYALAALAVGVGMGGDARQQAFSVLNSVARIGTHILHFAQFLKHRSGWGRSVRNAFKKWYFGRAPEKMAYQVMKYQSRDGWSHKDILRMCHALDKHTSSPQKQIFEYVMYDKISEELLSGIKIIRAAEMAKKAKAAEEIVSLIMDEDLPRELIPTQFLNDKDVWQALLDGMLKNNLLEALVRNLNKLTSLGLLDKRANEKAVIDIFKTENLKAARLHPLKILLALRTYESGHGLRGSMTWTPNPRITRALDDAFYAAFGLVEPTNKRICVAIDVSGSMDGTIDGTNISARDAATCLAMMVARSEPNHEIFAVSDTLTPFPINPRASMRDVINLQRNIPFGWTHLSLPLEYAIKAEKEFDAFVLITDNDVNRGYHVAQLLKDYRKAKYGVKDAQFVVIATTATPFSVADPGDPGMLDVVGFDAAIPEILSSFFKHEI